MPVIKSIMFHLNLNIFQIIAMYIDCFSFYATFCPWPFGYPLVDPPYCNGYGDQHVTKEVWVGIRSESMWWCPTIGTCSKLKSTLPIMYNLWRWIPHIKYNLCQWIPHIMYNIWQWIPQWHEMDSAMTWDGLRYDMRWIAQWHEILKTIILMFYELVSQSNWTKFV